MARSRSVASVTARANMLRASLGAGWRGLALSAHGPCVLTLMSPTPGEPIAAPVVARGVAVRGSVGVVARAVAVAVGRVGIGGRIIVVAVRWVPVARAVAVRWVPVARAVAVRWVPVARAVAVAVVGARGGGRCEPEEAAGDRAGRNRAAIVGP